MAALACGSLLHGAALCSEWGLEEKRKAVGVLVRRQDAGDLLVAGGARVRGAGLGGVAVVGRAVLCARKKP